MGQQHGCEPHCCPWTGSGANVKITALAYFNQTLLIGDVVSIGRVGRGKDKRLPGGEVRPGRAYCLFRVFTRKRVGARDHVWNVTCMAFGSHAELFTRHARVGDKVLVAGTYRYAAKGWWMAETIPGIALIVDILTLLHPAYKHRDDHGTVLVPASDYQRMAQAEERLWKRLLPAEPDPDTAVSYPLHPRSRQQVPGCSHVQKLRHALLERRELLRGSHQQTEPFEEPFSDRPQPLSMLSRGYRIPKQLWRTPWMHKLRASKNFGTRGGSTKSRTDGKTP